MGALKSLAGRRQYEIELFLTIGKTCCLSGNVRIIISHPDCHGRSKLNRTVLLLISTFMLFGCADDSPGAKANYFDNSGRDDVLSGGVKMIPVATPKGPFQVWTKRVGNNPTMKVLLVCGELVFKPRQAGDRGLCNDFASGRNRDLQPSVDSSRVFDWGCHRPTHNGSAGRCRNP